MRPYPGIRVSQADALFASRLQRGDEPNAYQVRAVITAAADAVLLLLVRARALR